MPPEMAERLLVPGFANPKTIRAMGTENKRPGTEVIAGGAPGKVWDAAVSDCQVYMISSHNSDDCMWTTGLRTHICMSNGRACSQPER